MLRPAVTGRLSAMLHIVNIDVQLPSPRSLPLLPNLLCLTLLCPPICSV